MGLSSKTSAKRTSTALQIEKRPRMVPTTTPNIQMVRETGNESGSSGSKEFGSLFQSDGEDELDDNVAISSLLSHDEILSAPPSPSDNENDAAQVLVSISNAQQPISRGTSSQLNSSQVGGAGGGTSITEDTSGRRKKKSTSQSASGKTQQKKSKKSRK